MAAPSPKITEAETRLNAMLPATRLQHSPPAELMAAAETWSALVWDAAQQAGPILLDDEQLTNGLNLAKSQVFICGVHRSGTTLVRDLLDGHPELVVLPSEGTYYTNIEARLLKLPASERIGFLGREWLRRLANPINQPPYWLLGRSSDSASPYIDFARYLLAWWPVLQQDENTWWPHTAIILAYASCTGNLTAKAWVDKTPTNERFIERIWREMPQAKIIHVLRDPIATLASRKKMEPGISLPDALKHMKTSFHVANHYATDPRFMLVRYEELCENPQEIMQKLASFLNIIPSATLGKPTVAGMPAQANSSFNRTAISGQILKPGEHQQDETLSVTELQMAGAFIGRLANKLNYPVIKPGNLRGFYLRFKHRLL